MDCLSGMVWLDIRSANGINQRKACSEVPYFWSESCQMLCTVPKPSPRLCNMSDPFGVVITQFDAACARGSRGVCLRLFYKFNLGPKQLRRTRALRLAAKNGHFRIVVILSAYCNLQDHRALWEAAKGGHLEMFKFLDQNWKGSANARRVYLSNALFVAAQQGHEDMCAWLSSYPATRDIIHTVPSGVNYRCPIFVVAAKHGHLSVCKMLLSAMANHGVCFLEPPTILMFSRALVCASAGGHLETVEWLARPEKGIFASWLSNPNWCSGAALTVAARNNHLSVCQKLMQCGAVVNVNNFAALRAACKHGHLEICQWIHDHGCPRIATAVMSLESTMMCFHGVLRDIEKAGHKHIYDWFISLGVRNANESKPGFATTFDKIVNINKT